MEDLQGIIQNQGPVKLVVVNFPHNPTGQLLSLEEWKLLIKTCADSDCYLFSDEMYRGLELEADTKLPAACDVYDKAISLSGVSKTHGLPGLRIGWISSRAAVSEGDGSVTAYVRPLQERIRELKDYTTICCSAPSEVPQYICVCLGSSV